MAKTIAIDDDVFDTLKRFARPLEDTPSTVIRRLVEIVESSTSSSLTPTTEAGHIIVDRPKQRVRSVDRTPQAAFRAPVLEVLREMGGAGLLSDVLDRVREKMKDKLTAFDFTTISTGEERWRVYARWERKNMALEGLLAGPHGFWQLTEKGRAYRSRGESAA